MNPNNSAERYKLSPIDLEKPKNAHDFQVLLTGTSKKVLEFGPATGYISKILKQRGCTVTGIEVNSEWAKEAERFMDKMIVRDAELLNLDDVLGSEKYDVILMGDFLEHLKEPIKLLKKLPKFLDKNGYIVCSIPNIAHITIRLKLLDGNFNYESAGLLDKTHLHFFTLETILEMLDESGYSITELHRVIEEVYLPHRTDLKNYTIPSELMEAILRDPEATTYQYVFKAVFASHNDIETRKWMLEFPKNYTTERLWEMFHYYKENLVSKLEKIIQEKDAQIVQHQVLSNKFKKMVDDLYIEILHRHADLQGLEHYGSLLENKKMKREELKRVLLESDEYKEIQKREKTKSNNN